MRIASVLFLFFRPIQATTSWACMACNQSSILVRINDNDKVECSASNGISCDVCPINFNISTTLTCDSTSNWCRQLRTELLDNFGAASNSTLIGILAGIGALFFVGAIVLYWYCRRKRVQKNCNDELMEHFPSPIVLDSIQTGVVDSINATYSGHFIVQHSSSWDVFPTEYKVLGRNQFDPSHLERLYPPIHFPTTTNSWAKTIYRAKYNNTIDVVVKQRILEPKDHNRDFINDIQVQLELNHYAIVPLLGVFWLSHTDFNAVFLYCEHGTLSHYVAVTPLTWKDKVDIAVDVLEALVYLHDNGIVHGDLTMHNIFVEKRARLSNFGIFQTNRQQVRKEDDMMNFGRLLAELESPRFFSHEMLSTIHLFDEHSPFRKIGLQCLSSDPTARPTAAQALVLLQEERNSHHSNMQPSI